MPGSRPPSSITRPSKGREAFDAVLTVALKEAGVDIVCNAGFMRLHSAAFVREWSGRQLNIHPSLLPAFRGLHPHAQALEAGVRVTGATVHFVSEDMDAGPIVAQERLPRAAWRRRRRTRFPPAFSAWSIAFSPLALRLVGNRRRPRLEGGRVIYAADAPPAFPGWLP